MRRQKAKEDSSTGFLRVDSVFQHYSQKHRPTSHYVFMICVVAVCVVAVSVGLGTGLLYWLNPLPNDPYRRAHAILAEYPVIDG